MARFNPSMSDNHLPLTLDSQNLIRKFFVTQTTAFNHRNVNFYVIYLCFPAKVITLEIEAERLTNDRS